MSNFKITLFLVFVFSACSSSMRTIELNRLSFADVIDNELHYYGYTPALGDSVFTWGIVEAIEAGIIVDSIKANDANFKLFGRAFYFDSSYAASEAEVIFAVLSDSSSSNARHFHIRKSVKCDKSGKFKISGDILNNSFLAIRNWHTYMPAMGMYSQLYRIDRMIPK